MLLPSVRQKGTLIKRYKRFLADILLPNGNTLTVHCPNSGSMRGCSTPGSQVIISKSDNPNRKYSWTLEMVREEGVWIGVNTSLTNKLVHEALLNGKIDDFEKIETITPEVKVSSKSRLDFKLENGETTTYLEVKNCSLVENRVALFPDAVTSRGTKHLHELMRLKDEGYPSAVLFCVQREDATSFMPAIDIDPVYSEALYTARKRGVKILAYRTEMRLDSISILHKIPAL